MNDLNHDSHVNFISRNSFIHTPPISIMINRNRITYYRDDLPSPLPSLWMKLHPRGCSRFILPSILRFSSLACVHLNKNGDNWPATTQIELAYTLVRRGDFILPMICLCVHSQCQPVKGRSSLVNFVCPSSKRSDPTSF